MLPKIFLLFLSLQYFFASNYGEELYHYERAFRSRVEPDRHMEPYLIEGGDRQSSCEPPINCNPDYSYRTIPGLCNNIDNPYWGVSRMPFKRLLFPAYGNGVDSPRGDGQNPFLPPPRKVSFPLHNIRDPTLPPNDGISLMVMQFGQFIDHDMFFTPEKEEIEGCCDDFQTVTTRDPECRALDVTNDPFYGRFGVRCLQFIRSIPVNPACSGARHREQQSNLTAYIDGSQVYGSTLEESIELRDERDPAFLKISSLNEDSCTAICPLNILPIRDNEGEPEFFGGDSRVEEQPGLTAMHTIFLRFHNDLANEFRKRYRNTVSCDFIFEEVRRIVSATIQQILYNEWLPIVIGSRAAAARGITILPGETYETRYDRFLDASARNVFAAAVFRFGHTLIPDIYNLPGNIQVLLARSFFSHTRTITRGTFPSDFIQGIAANTAQKFDHIMVDTLINKLFAEAPYDFGSDLLARNIMRAREHGIPGYNAWRNHAGLRNFTSFDQLYGVMADPVVDLFRSLYRSVNDIDLFPALISEYSDGNSLVGPLLRELLGELFHKLKFGDRFWFENINQPKPFTRKQLGSLHRTLLSSLICAYTDARSVQRYAMYAVSSDNPLVPCSEILKVGVLNDITLYWL